MVGVGEPVEILGPPSRFVSRGGDKLAAALDTFGIDVHGARVLDAGASTGGFTDCLLAGRAPRRSSPSTSGTGSSTRGCATTPGSRCTSG